MTAVVTVIECEFLSLRARAVLIFIWKFFGRRRVKAIGWEMCESEEAGVLKDRFVYKIAIKGERACSGFWLKEFGINNSFEVK